MKIKIIQNETIQETEITIRARHIDDELSEVITCISLIGNTLVGEKEGIISIVALKDIYYFESVDNKTFFYTKEDVFETKSRLYELCEKLANTSFIRISKSTIVNLRKLKNIKRSAGARLEAELVNGEKLMVSRQYVNDIKNKLGV